MAIAPKTIDDLRDHFYNDRLIYTMAAVLPNLPADESLIELRGWGAGKSWGPVWESDDDVVDDFRDNHDPIVRGTDVYRVEVITKNRPEDRPLLSPVPHGSRRYRIQRPDFDEYPTLDPCVYDFADDEQTELTDFGMESPHFTAMKPSGDWPRDPHLPV